MRDSLRFMEVPKNLCILVLRALLASRTKLCIGGEISHFVLFADHTRSAWLIDSLDLMHEMAKFVRDFRFSHFLYFFFFTSAFVKL